MHARHALKVVLNSFRIYNLIYGRVPLEIDAGQARESWARTIKKKLKNAGSLKYETNGTVLFGLCPFQLFYFLTFHFLFLFFLFLLVNFAAPDAITHSRETTVKVLKCDDACRFQLSDV
jgi:hypothetical protein